MAQQPQSNSPASWIAAAIPLLLLGFLARVGMIAFPFRNDSGLYAAMGRTLVRGGTLYRDFFETKLPGVGLIAAGFWRAFGSNWVGYVLAQWIATLIASALLARSVHCFPTSGVSASAATDLARSRAIATFLYAMVLLNFAWFVFTGFQLETLQATFEIIATAFALNALSTNRKADAFGAGLAAGVAAMLKPSGLAPAGALLLMLAWHHRRDGLSLVIAMTTGIAIPTAATLLYVQQAQLWQYLPNVLRQISLYASETPLDWFAAVKLILVLTLLALPAWPVLIRREANATRASNVLQRYAIIWFALALLGIVLQRRLYMHHFLPLAGPAALLFATIPGQRKPIQIFAGLLPVALLSLRYPATAPLQIGRYFVPDPVARYVERHTAPGDAVYADQIGKLLIDTNREPGSRYGTLFYFINYDNAPLDFCRGMIADFEQTKPKYIVDGHDAVESRRTVREPVLDLCPIRREHYIRAVSAFDHYLQRRYVVEVVIDHQNIYRRLDDTALSSVEAVELP